MQQIGYLFWEAFRGFKSDKFLSATSVITIGICTSVFACALIALSLVLALAGRNASESVLRVFLKPEAEAPAALAGLEARLKKTPGIDSLAFVSKDDALMEFKRDFGDDMLRYLDANPLPHSFLVYPSPAYQAASQNRLLRRRLELMEEVEAVGGDALYLSWLDNWKLPVLVGAGLLTLFIAVALTLIVQNAVKLNLYARRVLVENMKYCGASEGFVIAPFLLEGLFLGLGGSAIGLGTFAFLLALMRLVSPGLPALVDKGACGFAIVFATSAISAAASARTVRFFLRGA